MRQPGPPTEPPRLTIPLVLALAFVAVWLFASGDGDETGDAGESAEPTLVQGSGAALSREGMAEPTLVQGSGAALSREGMAAAGAPDGCDGCSAVQELEAAVSPTATPEPTATPTAQPTPSSYRPPFSVDAKAVAVLEAPCGALVYGKSEHERLPPASLTKIVTALAAIDRVDLSDSVEVNLSAKELKQRTRSSVMGLEPGMQVTVEDLLYGLFLPSGNDAAIVLAEEVSGDIDAFVDLMNQTAAGLGMHDSSFSNPHGLDSSRQRSSAYDMAVAGMALMKNSTLAAISQARSYALPGGLSFDNGNRLLRSYPGAYGVKIGYTNSARHTIVGAAEQNGRDLYVAVLGSDDLYNETAKVLDWAFAETPSVCGG